MTWLADMATRFRVLVLAIAAAILIFGIGILRTAPIDVLPEFSPPVIDIQTEAPGLSANEVEVMVTATVEELMSGLPWLKTLSSESVTGLSTVHLIFQPGTEVLHARQLVQERLISAFLLPNVARPPVMLQPLSSTNRVMMVALTSKEVDPTQLSVLVQWTIKPKLLGLPGVANIAVWGDRARQIQVQLEPDKVKAADLNQDQIIRSTGNALWVSQLS
jgi:Cu/Ag efflux pump CusA